MPGFSDSIGLLFKIRSDSDQAQSDIKNLRSTYLAEVKAIEQGGTNSFLKLGDSIGLSAGQMAGLSTAADVTGKAILAVGGFALGAAAGILALVKSTAEYGGEIYDLSTKVNFSAETLSALKIGAENSGSSLQALAASLGIFDKNLEAAAENGGSKMGKLFAQLHIDVDDNEKALRQMFTTLAKMPEGAQQTALALAAFGKSGKDVLGVIKEFHGDLEGAIKQLSDFGLIVSGDAAQKADQFSDKLHLVSLQAQGVGRAFGEEMMPVVLDALNFVSDSIQNNQDTIHAWSQNISDFASGAVSSMKTSLSGLDVSLGENNIKWKELGEGMGFWVTQVGYVLKGIAAIGNDLAWLGTKIQEAGKGWQLFWAAIQPGGGVDFRNPDWKQRLWNKAFPVGQAVVDTTHDQPYMSPSEIAAAQANEASVTTALARGRGRADTNFGLGGKSGGASKAAAEAEKARQESIRQLEEEVRKNDELYKRDTENAKREYGKHLISLRAFTAEAVRLEEERFTKDSAILERRKALAKTQSETDKVTDDIQKRQDERDRNIQALKDEQQQKEFDSLKEHQQALFALYEDYGKRKIDSLQRLAEAGKITFAQAENDEYAIQLDLLNKKREALLREEEDAGRDLELKRRINDEITKLLADRRAVEDKHRRKLEEGRQKDLDKELAYLNALYDAEKMYQAQERELQRQRLEQLSAISLLTTQQHIELIKQQTDLDLEDINEQQRHAQNELDIWRDQRLKEAKNQEERTAAWDNYYALLGQIEEKYGQERRARLARAQAEADSFNPLSASSILGTDIAAQIDIISDALGRNLTSWEKLGVVSYNVLDQMRSHVVPLGQMLGQFANSVGMGLANMVQQYILLGTTGSASVRKLVATSIAEFAKMATFNAIYYTAQGIVDIFFDPPRAAADFTAAAMWFGLAGGSALLGRAVAGSSFQQQGGGAAATSGTVNRSIAGNSSSGGGSDELKIIERSRYDQPPLGELPMHRELTRMQQQMDRMMQHQANTNNLIDRLVDKEHRIVLETHTDGASMLQIVKSNFNQIVHDNRQGAGVMYNYAKKSDL
jgi:hypothetical protein